jgi:hypothetical protein
MNKQTAAVLKGDDPRPQLPLKVFWTVKPTELSEWTALEFTAETSGHLTGTVILNGATVNIDDGHIDKNSKVKFSFRDDSGTLYVAEGTYKPAHPANHIDDRIEEGKVKHKKSGNDDGGQPFRATDDGTWTATAQTGPIAPDY